MSQSQGGLVSGIEQPLTQEGYTVVDLLDGRSLQKLRTDYNAFAHPVRAGFDSTILSRDIGYRAAVDEAIRSVIEPALVPLIPDHRVAFCTFAVKAPDSPESEVPLHQDWSFVDERCYKSIGLWVPLIDVALGNGCLQVVPGSHALPHAPRAACTPFAYPELVPYLRAECLENVPMKAGQAMLFDNRLFHCSVPNRSAGERIAATAVLVPKTCTMRYYHVVDPRHLYEVEVFEVEDSFFLHHTPGTRPENATSLGIIDLRSWTE